MMLLLLLPVATGLMLAAAFPRMDQGWLAWIAWIPLILFVVRSNSRRAAFAGGWIAGVFGFFISLRWMPEVMLKYGGMHPISAWAAYALLIFILACYPAAVCAGIRHLMFCRGRRMILLFPFAWVVMEFFQSVTPIGGLPWLLAGYTQTRFLPAIQIADITGIYGVSFLVLGVNTAIVWYVLRQRRGFAAYAPLLSIGVLFAGALIYGQNVVSHMEKIDARLRAALLQGNLSIDEPRSVLYEKFPQGYERMADSLAADSVDILVLPESPTPKIFSNDENYRHAMEALARRYPLGMVFGNTNTIQKADGTEVYFNSAFFLDRHGALTGIYDKIHLVPFGEYIPHKRVFFFAETVSDEMGGFSAGKDFRILNLGEHPSNAVICFEAAFPDLVRRFVNQGSQVIVNLVNDGWYGVSDAPYQHLAIARVRAVENRRYMLRAANSGISAVIEPTGRIQTSTGLMQEDICQGRFAFLIGKTFYTRYGDVFVFLCAIICVGFCLGACTRRQMSASDNPVRPL